MSEKICNQGHVMDSGKELCSRCNSPEEVKVAPVPEILPPESSESEVVADTNGEQPQPDSEETPAPKKRTRKKKVA